MYLTSHKVRSPRGDCGINSFLFLHKDQAIPERRPCEPDIDYVSRFACSTFVASDQQIAPGGNVVLVYLECVGPDTASESGLSKALEAVKARIGSARFPITEKASGVVARIGVTLEFEEKPSELKVLLEKMWKAAVDLLDRRGTSPPPVKGRYVVWALYGSNGIRMWLPASTRNRLPQSPERLAHVLLPSESLRSSPLLDLLRASAITLLGVTEDRVQEAGGIEIVDPHTGKTFAQY